MKEPQTPPHAEITCNHPRCEKTSAEIVNGCLTWRVKHSGETHVQFLGIEHLARLLAGAGFALVPLSDLDKCGTQLV